MRVGTLPTVPQYHLSHRTAATPAAAAPAQVSSKADAMAALERAHYDAVSRDEFEQADKLSDDVSRLASKEFQNFQEFNEKARERADRAGIRMLAGVMIPALGTGLAMAGLAGYCVYSFTSGSFGIVGGVVAAGLAACIGWRFGQVLGTISGLLAAAAMGGSSVSTGQSCERASRALQEASNVDPPTLGWAEEYGGHFESTLNEWRRKPKASFREFFSKSGPDVRRNLAELAREHRARHELEGIRETEPGLEVDYEEDYLLVGSHLLNIEN